MTAMVRKRRSGVPEKLASCRTQPKKLRAYGRAMATRQSELLVISGHRLGDVRSEPVAGDFLDDASASWPRRSEHRADEALVHGPLAAGVITAGK
jgi:hypothetical protein